MGCPAAGCTGYELDADLDFDTDGDGSADSGDDYWNDGAGWAPIQTGSSTFGATFDGNGRTISSLFINRANIDDVGLFGNAGSASVIRNTGLPSVNVTGSTWVGGLVGYNRAGEITASYATGSVTGTGSNVGGLVGYSNTVGTTTASYWDTEASGQTTSGGGVGQTTSQLQSPTGYTGIYANWNVNIDGADGGDNPWDFGTASQYPTINYVPRAPTMLSALSGDGQVTLTWATAASSLPIMKYQFQVDGSGRGWQDIPGSDADTTSYTVTGLTNGQSYTFRVRAVNSNGNGAEALVSVVPTEPVDYDADDDGLIEVSSLAQLNAIRWDLDGDGSAADTDTAYAAVFPNPGSGMGCPATGCTGYELVADLDFDTDGDGSVDSDDDYWNDFAGWGPVGTQSVPFGATFDGNGHTISSLFINRANTDDVGLFGGTNSTSVIRNTGLRSVNVTGNRWVGGLVGTNNGTITASYASGSVTGTGSNVGGLVGINVSGTTNDSYWDTGASGQITSAGGVARPPASSCHPPATPAFTPTGTWTWTTPTETTISPRAATIPGTSGPVSSIQRCEPISTATARPPSRNSATNDQNRCGPWSPLPYRLDLPVSWGCQAVIASRTSGSTCATGASRATNTARVLITVTPGRRTGPPSRIATLKPRRTVRRGYPLTRPTPSRSARSTAPVTALLQKA